MRRRILRGANEWALAAAASLGVALSAGAQVPLGDQFQVNTYTTNFQAIPSVAVASDGSFVVVWNSSGSFASDQDVGILGQRYASDGSTIGGEFQVNTYTTGQQAAASVSMDSAANFVVAWESLGSPEGDSSDRSIQARRFASNGSALGGQFQVNNYTTGAQTFPSVAAASDGAFVIAWSSNGSQEGDSSGNSIQARRFGSNGVELDDQYQINNYTTSNQSYPSVTAADSGAFVVAWQSSGSLESDSSSTSVHARRFGSNGVELADQFQVNTYTTNAQGHPSVADLDGGFVVTWHSNGSSGPSTSGYSIQGQRYASDGSALGGQFQVNSTTTAFDRSPAVIGIGEEFVVAWESAVSVGKDDDGQSIQARRFVSDGSPVGGQFQVNAYTLNHQNLAAVGANSTGFVVAWTSVLAAEDDPSESSVHARRFAYGMPLAVPSLSPGGAAAAALLMLAAVAVAFRRRPRAQ